MYILTGFKRIHLSKEIGLVTIICKVVNQSEINFDECIKIIYEDNKDRFTDIEIGQLCKKCLDNGYSIKEFLKLIDYPATEKNINRFNYLSRITKEILNYYLDQKISSEQCYLLTQISEEDALLIISKLIIPFRFNTNETRELIGDLNEISIRDDLSISELAGSILNCTEETDKNSIRYEIKKLRSPRLIEAEKQFNEIVKTLKLPKNISLNHPIYFENNYIEFKARIDSDKKLTQLKNLFNDEENYKRFLRLLSLVREGL
ncbi:MAG: hypothetical protein GWN11_06625 [Candidatus Dadabacteria bacterium]|nr:hypothetical protein [Candidatus Dadabacteria bacterium]